MADKNLVNYITNKSITLKSMGLILNSIQGHSTILCLKKEAVGFSVKEINMKYQFD